MGGPALGRVNDQSELIADDLEEAILIGSIPVWERAGLDMNGNASIGLADCVCAEIRHGPLDRGPAFFRSHLRDLPEMLDRILGTVSAHGSQDVVAACIKEGDARWICPK